jgi:hypothetical protein
MTGTSILFLRNTESRRLVKAGFRIQKNILPEERIRTKEVRSDVSSTLTETRMSVRRVPAVMAGIRVVPR